MRAVNFAADRQARRAFGRNVGLTDRRLNHLGHCLVSLLLFLIPMVNTYHTKHLLLSLKTPETTKNPSKTPEKITRPETFSPIYIFIFLYFLYMLGNGHSKVPLFYFYAKAYIVQATGVFTLGWLANSKLLRAAIVLSIVYDR